MTGRTGRRAIVPTCLVMLLACAGHRIPSELRGYVILVERGGPGEQEANRERDELARAFRAGGFTVRRAVRGGSGPTAALVYFTFQGRDSPGGPTRLHLRLADTRSGIILRAATLAVDSLPAEPRQRAVAAVRALLAPDSTLLAP